MSSGEAELAGIVKAASEGLGLRSLHIDHGLQISFELHADSSAAIGMAERVGIGRVRHIDVGQLWVQQRLRHKDFKLHKCLGTNNPADILTKHVARILLDALLSRLGVCFELGRAASAPELV